jgi:hypothetical protein
MSHRMSLTRDMTLFQVSCMPRWAAPWAAQVQQTQLRPPLPHARRCHCRKRSPNAKPFSHSPAPAKWPSKHSAAAAPAASPAAATSVPEYLSHTPTCVVVPLCFFPPILVQSPLPASRTPHLHSPPSPLPDPVRLSPISAGIHDRLGSHTHTHRANVHRRRVVDTPVPPLTRSPQSPSPSPSYSSSSSASSQQSVETCRVR